MKEILCENCKKKKATFFYEENRNGKVKKICLCSDCAAKAGLSVGKMFSEDELFGAFSLFPSQLERKHVSEERCPVCRKSLSEIRQSGKFGCSACYDTFAERLDLTPFLGKDFHGAPLTKKAAAATKETKEAKEAKEDPVLSLKKELEQAVLAEEYEKAAALRDKIRGLEAK